jgi:SAM-dependent methyltransferase
MTVTPHNPAETYEQFMVPALFAPCADHLVAAADPRPDARVLDIATGTGIVARKLAFRLGPGGAVTGLDVSPGMLAVARDRAASEGAGIAWVEGRAEALPFPDGAFDLVTCQFGLMFFADRDAAMTEAHRVLAPGGRMVALVFQDIARHPFYVRLDQVIRDRFDVSGVGDIFALGDRDALGSLVTRAGFEPVAIQPFELVARFPDPDAFLAGEIDVDTASIPAMQHLDVEARAAMVDAIATDMRDALREVTAGDVVAMPFHTLIAIATR